MATQSPFSYVQDFLGTLASGRTGQSAQASQTGQPRLDQPDFFSSFAPPAWAIDEAQRRIVLLLNHILIQEKEATSRLSRQKGQVILMQWRFFAMKLIATPAGLLDLAGPAALPDLTLVVTQESPIAIAQALLRGDKPGVRIEGDVQLAAEVNWLVDHIRWDIEEDMSRIMGDVPAHMLGRAVRAAGDALRQFIGGSGGTHPPGGGATP